MNYDELSLYSAFTDTPSGGNPAGVWIADVLPDDDAMLRIADEVGFSETVFAKPAPDDSYDVRYFSPKAEVSFCGHVTIALGARLAQERGAGRYLLNTQAGEVWVDVDTRGEVGEATLTSVAPHYEHASPALVGTVLDLLGRTKTDLDPTLAPAVTFAGANHLVVPLDNRDLLRDIDYDFDSMLEVMEAHDLTTVNVIFRESNEVVHARNLFPVGGVIEDPATGAAAAALGGYLRELAPSSVPLDFVIHQGDDLGRPSLLRVHAPLSGGIEVSGQAVPIPESKH